MDKNVSINTVYQSLCRRHNIPVNETILSSLFNASAYNELNLENNTISNMHCFWIAETLKLMPIIKVLNLTDCLLSFEGFKYFMDIINQLKDLSLLNLKGNQIENEKTNYISKSLLNNSSITNLQLNWNNIGYSKDMFAQLCNCLMSTTVLNTLNLAHNNLCETCALHMAKLLNKSSSLKNIDLSYNNICEPGAGFLLSSLQNNENITELDIQCNGVTEETCFKMEKILKQNKSKEINENRNSSLHNNYETELNSLNDQYHKRIDELQSKIRNLQVENLQQKHELEGLKNSNLKEKESSIVNLNQVEKMKSELFFKEESLKSFINQLSDEVSYSDRESMHSLDEFEKIIFIVKQIKKKCANKLSKETKTHQRLLETLPKLTNEINTLKAELKNLKTSTEMQLINYCDELGTTKKLLLDNIFQLRMLKNIDDEINMKNLIGQQDDKYIYDEQTKSLELLNANLDTLLKEKVDLERRLAKSETQSELDTQAVQALVNSLKLANDELEKLEVKRRSTINDQILSEKLYNEALTKEKNDLFDKLKQRNQQLRRFEIEKQQMDKMYSDKLSILQKQLQSEKQKFKEKKKEHLKALEEVYSKFTQYVTRVQKDTT